MYIWSYDVNSGGVGKYANRNLDGKVNRLY